MESYFAILTKVIIRINENLVENNKQSAYAAVTGNLSSGHPLLLFPCLHSDQGESVGEACCDNAMRSSWKSSP